MSPSGPNLHILLTGLQMSIKQRQGEILAMEEEPLQLLLHLLGSALLWDLPACYHNEHTYFGRLELHTAMFGADEGLARAGALHSQLEPTLSSQTRLHILLLVYKQNLKPWGDGET
jgi:hypothetical protein